MQSFDISDILISHISHQMIALSGHSPAEIKGAQAASTQRLCICDSLLHSGSILSIFNVMTRLESSTFTSTSKHYFSQIVFKGVNLFLK